MLNNGEHGVRTIRDTPGRIRTDTVRILNPLPTTDWATGAC